LQNLIASTEIGTFFLDQQLRIRLFTPPVATYFNITKADLGRVITDFTHRLKYGNLQSNAKKVLEELAPIEAEVRTEDDHWLMVRTRPYRTVDNMINGLS
jgi:two-component system, chemotaxis family, CheB/CheR fusion protein